MKVIEKFVSIDGEGPSSGFLSVFLRFSNCNLKCDWCDTKYSWENENSIDMTINEILEYVEKQTTKYITITGGEPLLQKDLKKLLMLLVNKTNKIIHIETNGSININNLREKIDDNKIRYIVDYKLSSSKMSKFMDESNFKNVTKNDVYKFVIGSIDDLNESLAIIKENDLSNKTNVYISPILDKVSGDTIIKFLTKNKLFDIKVQIQIHKILWDPSTRGV